MEADKREALLKSRRHYIEMRDNEIGMPNGAECACCELDKKHGRGCNYCPISDYTNEYACRGTPFSHVESRYHAYGIKHAKFKLACTEMIEFFDKILEDDEL